MTNRMTESSNRSWLRARMILVSCTRCDESCQMSKREFYRLSRSAAHARCGHCGGNLVEPRFK
jgi:predicted SprT family Zn-dependent metalloprotease